MRNVSSIPPAPQRPNGSLVPSLTAVHAAKHAHPREQTVQPLVYQQERQEALPPVGQESRGTPLFVERRVACRRIQHQKVLIELRSGLDRRQHNLLGGGSEHINEQA